MFPTCTGDDEIVIYDCRVTVLNHDGGLDDEYLLRFGDRSPYGRIKCSPSRRIVFMRYADEEGSEVRILRAGIPGADRMAYFRNGLLLQMGPLTWGRTEYMAPVDEGVWIDFTHVSFDGGPKPGTAPSQFPAAMFAPSALRMIAF